MVAVGDEIRLDAVVLHPSELARTGRSCAISGVSPWWQTASESVSSVATVG